MERRQRTITLANSEKLSNMSRDEVEVLMRELGEKGLNPLLREKNIPPELLEIPEAARGNFRFLNFREYTDLVNSLGLKIGEHTPGNFWWTLKRADIGIVRRAKEPFYEIDMKQYLQEYANADTRSKKGKVMDRHSINLIHSQEFMDTEALIEAIEDGTLAEANNIGTKMLGLSVALANQVIRDARENESSRTN